jgi:hypothetical protein
MERITLKEAQDLFNRFSLDDFQNIFNIAALKGCRIKPSESSFKKNGWKLIKVFKEEDSIIRKIWQRENLKVTVFTDNERIIKVKA